MKLYRKWIINEVARAGEHTNERTYVRTYVLTYIRTGQTLYPLHNFVVRGDNKGCSEIVRKSCGVMYSLRRFRWEIVRRSCGLCTEAARRWCGDCARAVRSPYDFFGPNDHLKSCEFDHRVASARCSYNISSDFGLTIFFSNMSSVLTKQNRRGYGARTPFLWLVKEFIGIGNMLKHGIYASIIYRISFCIFQYLPAAILHTLLTISHGCKG